MSAKQLAVFGEVLFDHFPDGNRVLGGAPFNVAWHLQAFGQAPVLVSRVGTDQQGRTAREAMTSWGMDTRALQTDPGLPTGRVQVQFVNKEPRYDIVHPAAFDVISQSQAADQFSTPIDLLYHGTLALRDEESRAGLAAMREYQPGLVFVDVNLRPPWWQREQVLKWVGLADWVKLNNDELQQLGDDEDHREDLPARFLEQHDLQGLVITNGERGAELLTHGGSRFTASPEPGAEVIDTVGAGDALTAVILLGLLNQWPLEMALRRAQAFASGICGRRGATVRDRKFYHHFIEDWQSRLKGSIDVRTGVTCHAQPHTRPAQAGDSQA